MDEKRLETRRASPGLASKQARPARSRRTKKPATPSPKRSSSAAPKASPAGPPFLRFYHSEDLRAKTLVILNTIEKSKDAKPHRGALADLVAELTDSGMEYYFLRPLKLAKVGFFVQQSANLGMAATKRIFGSVIRNIIGDMDNPQLLSVCGYIRQLMK